VRLCLRVFLCSYNFLSLLLSFLKAFTLQVVGVEPVVNDAVPGRTWQSE
jgi:hypothetical protein